MHRSTRFFGSFFATTLALALVPACAAEDGDASADDDSAEDDDAADDDTAVTDDDSAADDDAADDAADDDTAVTDDDAADDDTVVTDDDAADDAGASPEDAGSVAEPTPDAGDAALDAGDTGDAGEGDAGPAPEQELAIEEIGMFEPPSGSAEGVAVDGATAYVASTSAGVYVVDVSDASAPSVLGQYDFPSGQLAFRVSLDGTHLAVGLRGNGWALLDVADPANIQLLAQDDAVDASDVALRGDALYYLNANGPSSVDVSDPENPLPLVEDLVLPGADDSLMLMGDRLYVTQNGAGFSIVDAADPASLSELSSVAVGLGGNDLVRSGQSLFVSHSEGVEVFDVRDPEAPVPQGSYPRERAYLLALAYDRVMIFGDDTRSTQVPFIEVLDARDPSALVAQPQTYDDYADPVFVEVNEERLYVSVGDDDSLHIFGLALVPPSER